MLVAAATAAVLLLLNPRMSLAGARTPTPPTKLMGVDGLSIGARESKTVHRHQRNDPCPGDATAKYTLMEDLRQQALGTNRESVHSAQASAADCVTKCDGTPGCAVVTFDTREGKSKGNCHVYGAAVAASSITRAFPGFDTCVELRADWE